MVKIGRWAEPYTEPGNPFPDETDSFAAMPPESPMHILPYGILSDMILPLIKVKRREKREQRKEFLIKKTLNVNLKMCLEELYRLSKLYPRKEMIPNLKSYHMNNKRNMMRLIDDCEIPLIYLEETYQKQLQGPPKLEIGDWVECPSYSGGHYGIVISAPGKRGDITVRLVKQVRWWFEGTYYNYPVFHRWERNSHPCRSKQMSRWTCKKIGHDTQEWVRLRNKIIIDHDKDVATRTSIWKDKLLPTILQCHFPEDNAYLRERYKAIWYNMDVNLLDKSIWESMEEDNVSCYSMCSLKRRHSVGHIMNLKNIIIGYDILD